MKKADLLTFTVETLGFEKKKEAEDFLAKVDKLVKAVADEGSKTKIGEYIEVEKVHVEAKHKEAREGRNPRTGETLQIPAKDIPAHDEVKIKATKALSKAE
jgi:DNA-binding protein HU-beta